MCDVKIAVVILTKNEEKNILRCIESIKRNFSDIHVVDSLSQDSTLDISKVARVNTYVHKQVGTYSAAEQRNWAILNIDSSAEWVLFIDADEMMPNGFGEAVKIFLNHNYKKVEVVSIPLLYHFHGRAIKSMGYPNWHDRLLSRSVRFISAVGEFVDTKKRINFESVFLIHHFNSHGMLSFVEKQSRYADYIGHETSKYLNGIQDTPYFGKSGAKGYLKRFVAKLGLLRPLFRFSYQYFLKRGFLEGRPGFLVAIYMAFFEFMICVSIIETDRREAEDLL